MTYFDEDEAKNKPERVFGLYVLLLFILFFVLSEQSDLLKENKQGFVVSELVVGFGEQDTDHKFSQQ